MAFHTPGGGEVQLLQYRKYLPEAGVEVTLLDQWNPQFLNSDLVHFFSCMSGSLHFCAFVKKIGLPLAVSPNLWITEETRHLYPYDEIRTQFVLADKVIGNSDIECDVLARVFNMPRDRFVTVYNGVNEVFFEPTSPDIFREHFGIDGPFILNVANLEPRKNQLKLARALKEFPDLKLIMIGHERDPDYSQQCKAEGGDQLRYLGPLPHDSVLLRSAYSACELFALPSTLETPGLAALEAAACGAKVLVTSEGCTREYFGKGAVYVAPDNVDDISRGIAATLSQNKTFLPALCMRANFTWKHAAKTLSGFYDGIITLAPPIASSSGFYPIEAEGARFFAWSMLNASFACGAGTLSFIWHSVGNARVDLYIDDEPVQMDVAVGAHWSPFVIEILPAPGQVTREVFFRVREAAKPPEGDSRKLGVAFADVAFLASSHLPLNNV